MKSTKIKVDRRVISVLIYMMAALGGYTPMLLLAGYVFLYDKKDGDWKWMWWCHLL